MEQRIVSQQPTKYIYWIKDNDYSFYLSIPNTKQVGLIIDILSEVNDEKIINQPDITDSVLINPIIDNGLIEGIKQNSAESFSGLDNLISKSINMAHQILTYNKLTVNDSIRLNNNREFEMFNLWFIKKYNGRVTLIELNPKPELPEPSIEEPLPEKKTPIVEETIELDKQEAPTKSKSLGFVSYVLLGVGVAIGTLLFLYFIL